MKNILFKFLFILIAISLNTSCSKLDELGLLEEDDDTNDQLESGPPNLSAGEEWVKVPANAGGMGLPVFYIMKFEAKAMLNDESSVDADGIDGSIANWGLATHKPVSFAENLPWRRINAHNAAAECESLGSGYHLVSNSEWIAIARDLETQDTNWTNGLVGSGCLFRGNSVNGASSDSCGYNGADPEAGLGRNIRAKHTLSNGQEIYDLAGNLFEWTDWDPDTAGFQIGPTDCSVDSEISSVSCTSLMDNEYNTLNGGYTSIEGVGRFFSGSGGAALRGGSWINNANAGIFTLSLNYSDTLTNSGIGFRCVYRP